MPVSQNNCIQLTAFDLCFAPVLRAFLFAALEKTTVDQNAGVFSENLVRGSGYVAGRAKETNFHDCSSKRPAPLRYFRLVDAILMRIPSTLDLNVPELFLGMRPD